MEEAARRRRLLVGAPGLWEMKRRFQFTFLREVGLRQTDMLLDLGCGTLRGGIPLIDYLGVGAYTGIDVRSEAIAEAQQELAQHGLEHKRACLLVAEDLSGLQLERDFDVAWAFSVLIHMRDETLHDALGCVARHLAQEGRFYANVNIGDRKAAGWQDFPVVWRSLEFYATQAKEAQLQCEDMGALGDLGHASGVPEQDAQRMLVFRRL